VTQRFKVEICSGGKNLFLVSQKHNFKAVQIIKLLLKKSLSNVTKRHSSDTSIGSSQFFFWVGGAGGSDHIASGRKLFVPLL
jgi:hypothetical protein